MIIQAKINTSRPSRYIATLRFDSIPQSGCSTRLNSRSRWIIHLRHRNFTVQILTGFQVGPTFPIFPTFPYFFDPYFFMKMPYYPYFFTLKCHLRVKIPEIFPRSLHSLGFYKLTSMFSQGAYHLTPQFLMFNLKVSLFG